MDCFDYQCILDKTFTEIFYGPRIDIFSPHLRPTPVPIGKTAVQNLCVPPTFFLHLLGNLKKSVINLKKCMMGRTTFSCPAPLPAWLSRNLGVASSLLQNHQLEHVGDGKEPAVGWLRKVLGIHHDLNIDSSYSCDSAPQSSSLGVHGAGGCWLSVEEGTLSVLLGSRCPPFPLAHVSRGRWKMVNCLLCSVSFLNQQPTPPVTALPTHALVDLLGIFRGHNQT